VAAEFVILESRSALAERRAAKRAFETCRVQLAPCGENHFVLDEFIADVASEFIAGEFLMIVAAQVSGDADVFVQHAKAHVALQTVGMVVLLVHLHALR
jgi:hypothetical protein